jgi:pimeloyl-ACP methyl ester carboxylesterase
MKVVCLHGFLGSGTDFNFLQPEFDCFAPDLDSIVHLDIDEIDKVFFNESDTDFILVGYSFGARLAMQLFLKNPGRFSKLILLAGHMGLRDVSMRFERRVFEDKMVCSLKTLSMKDFISMWNEYDIFKYDKNIRFNSQDTVSAQKYFSKWGLSRQPFLLNDLLIHRDKIQVYYGRNDKKYYDYGCKSLTEFNVTYLDDVGHRIIQHHELIHKILRKTL